MKGLILFLIGLVFGVTGGFVVANGGAVEHDHAVHIDTGHDHAEAVMWDTSPLPDISLTLTPDSVSGQNLEMAVSDFAYMPEAVGQADASGGGHAHVYLNGKKVGRVYGPWVHLPTAESGDLVRVTLNTNAHAHWAGPDGPLAAEIVVP